MQASRHQLMLTACQIRMARAARRWSIVELARHSGVSEKTIRRIEKVFGTPPNVTVDILLKLQVCFEAQGFAFIPDDGGPGGPGVCYGNYPGRRAARPDDAGATGTAQPNGRNVTPSPSGGKG